MGDTEFTLINDSSWTQSKLNYPGGIALMRATAEAKLNEGSDTGNSYDFKYQLKLTGTSNVDTDLNWHLYELTEEEQSVQAVLGTKFGVSACKLVVDSDTQGQTHLYYTNDGQKHAADGSHTYDCTAKSLGIDAQLSEYEIASGTLKKTGGLENTKEDQQITDLNAIDREIKNVAKGQTVKKYYYLVLEYPNNPSNQATGDQGQSINLQLELVEGSVKAELAA